MARSSDFPHLKLIVSVARHLIESSPLCRRRLGSHVDAYLGAGYLGYLRAQRAYRADRGTSFTTYVVIQHFMLMEAYGSALVRLPLYAINEARRRALGLGPTRSCRMADTSVEAARSVFECEYRPLLLEHVEAGGLLDEGDCEAVDRTEALGYLRRVLREALDRLDPPLGKIVLVRSFGLEGRAATLNELARELDRTRDQVFRLKRSALRQMRALVDHDLFDAIPEPCAVS
jgi:hypothetical protein